MSARTELEAALKADAEAAGYTKWTIQAKPPTPSTTVGAGRRLICIMRTSVAASTVHGGFANHLDLWIVTGEEDYQAAEESLEPDLAALVAMLDGRQLNGDIERGVLNDTFHGYRIPLIHYTATP